MAYIGNKVDGGLADGNAVVSGTLNVSNDVTLSANVGIGTTSIDVSTQAGGSGYKVLQIENDEGGQINLDHNDAGTGSTLGQINFQRAGEVLAEIEGVTDGATDNAKINFRTQPDGGALTIRATIDHDGNFGIGETDPSSPLIVKNASDGKVIVANTAQGGGQGLGFFTDTSNNRVGIFNNSSGTLDMVFNCEGIATSGEAMRIVNDTKKIGIGRTDPSFDLDINGELRLASANSSLYLEEAAADAFGSHLVFRKTRNTTVGSHTVVQDGDTLGTIVFQGSDGSGMENAASIVAEVDGTPFSSSDSTDMPGRLLFKTTPDGSATPTERMRIHSGGHVSIGKDNLNPANAGVQIEAEGDTFITAEGSEGRVVSLKRLTSDGPILEFNRDTFSSGGVKVLSTEIAIHSGGTASSGIRFNNNGTLPTDQNGDIQDDTYDLGQSGVRWDDIFATNSTIQTSDENEKQDIASMTTAELAVGKRLSTLFKTFRWKSKVTEKADKARTHSGIVAQQVKEAFEAEGLDATKYALFCSDTWWEKEISVDAVEANEEKHIEAKAASKYMDIKYVETEGYSEKTRLGVRYPELLSFIASYNESRFTAIEARIAKLEE